ncbi:hypothetical protein O0L34_g18337 [Tuta absoluta]|nr:hypothetical protein O0L34_g18337 [Tuta absoluta]
MIELGESSQSTTKEPKEKVAWWRAARQPTVKIISLIVVALITLFLKPQLQQPTLVQTTKVINNVTTVIYTSGSNSKTEAQDQADKVVSYDTDTNNHGIPPGVVVSLLGKKK